jgi:hypothetical protein
MSQIHSKKKLIYSLLNKINASKRLHKKRSAKYKKIDDVTDGILTFCSTATVSTIMLSILSANPIALVVSAAFSTVSMIGGSVKKAINIKEKWAESKNSYSQLSDLSREISITLAKNHLSSTDLDNLLTDIHHRLGLIEDNEPILLASESPPASFASKDDHYKHNIESHSPTPPLIDLEV